MTGFKPELSCCTGCGRRPDGRARLYVEPAAGGVLCRHCRNGIGAGVTLSHPAVGLVRRACGDDPAAFPEAKPSREAAGEVWSFFDLFVPFFLERGIASLAFARELARRESGPARPGVRT